jgi:hypothetical protein
LGINAKALSLANRTSEELEAIKEAKAVAQKTEERCWCAELHRLHGMFLAAMGANEAQIESSFGEAVRVAKEQKSVSLEKRPKQQSVEGERAYILWTQRLPTYEVGTDRFVVRDSRIVTQSFIGKITPKG